MLSIFLALITINWVLGTSNLTNLTKEETKFTEPATPGENITCRLVTSSQLESVLTFITYCGKIENHKKEYPVYFYKLNESLGSKSLALLPRKAQLNHSLVKNTWEALQRAASDEIITSSVIFSNATALFEKKEGEEGDGEVPEDKGSYFLYFATTDWRNRTFTSFLSFSKDNIFVMAPFSYEQGDVYLSGCPVNCFYSLSQKDMTLASYMFLYSNEEMPPTDITDADTIKQSSKLFYICLELNDQGDMLHLEVSKCSGSAVSPSSVWANLTTGMLFKDNFYVFSLTKVFIFSATAFEKPETLVPLTTVSLKAFFGEPEDVTQTSKSNPPVTEKEKSVTVALEGKNHLLLIIVGVVGTFLVIIVVAVIVYFICASHKDKKKKDKKEKKDKKDKKMSKKESNSKIVSSEDKKKTKKSKTKRKSSKDSKKKSKTQRKSSKASKVPDRKSSAASSKPSSAAKAISTSYAKSPNSKASTTINLIISRPSASKVNNGPSKVSSATRLSSNVTQTASKATSANRKTSKPQTKSKP